MPILTKQSLEFISRGADQTRRVGMRLGSLLQTGDLICLIGELGSGKTTLVQGINAGWGSLDQVTSPTFVLINVYRRPEGGRLFHVDAYRLYNPREVIDLDLDSLLDTGPIVIEWADRIKTELPSDHLWVMLQCIDDTQRDILFEGCGDRYTVLVQQLQRVIYGIS